MTDFLVIGAGSAGCVLAAELARRQAGKVTIVEAGPSDRHPLVSIPFGLVWLIGGRRDWAYSSAPMEAAGGRKISIPRGRMLGGSGSINSMVWFRGRADDFDGWQIKGWGWKEVRPAFEEIETHLKPTRFAGAHTLTKGLAAMFGQVRDAMPTPEYESAGVFAHNIVSGQRNSAAAAYLRRFPEINVVTGAETDRLLWTGDRASGVLLTDGSELRANKGVVLSAGSIGSPSILLRSGVGPADDLMALGIDPRQDAPEVGANLHDHPGVALHYEQAGSGYGLEPRQWPAWAAAPFQYVLSKQGRLASPTVEGGAFFASSGQGEPDIQSHFIPFYLDWKGRKYRQTSGYFADVCLCRPKSRGVLRLASGNPKTPPSIDLGLFKVQSDLDAMAAGVNRLRDLLDLADFGNRRGREVFPGVSVAGDALKEHIRHNAGTAYHPVGTLRLGGPVSPRLRVKGADNLWVADASIMPKITSANTNAPSMMIGLKGAEFISEDAA